MDARGRRTPARPWWERLEQIRLRNGWSRVRLAEKAGVARSTIDGWRTNPRPPHNTTVTDVARRLGIDPEEALRLAGVSVPTPSTDPAGDEDPTDRLERLWREYRDDPGERGAVLRGLLYQWGEEDERRIG